MICQKHGVQSTFCRYCDLDTIENHSEQKNSKRIEVEESALDSLKEMAQRLQDERDELLSALVKLLTSEDYSEAERKARTAIAKCTGISSK